ncbi:unnamed protein product [Linum trigynum]|uniref:Uncharacterized protein n=1 Tax=Linum trigynum TaxID=586398 RepID=A0AAV2DWS4_9ROSI
MGKDQQKKMRLISSASSSVWVLVMLATAFIVIMIGANATAAAAARSMPSTDHEANVAVYRATPSTFN